VTRTRRAAVLGRPIAHSLSPALHTAAYAALGLPWDYSAVECGVAELPGVLAERADWAGFSCTMPLKRAVLDIAEDASALARAVGAGNTLVPRAGGGWRAENTDVAGIVAALGEGGAARPERVVLLGAGGTAQAAIAALAELGIRRCTVLVRNLRRTAELRASAQTLRVALDFGVLRPDAGELAADLVVSTLPRGAADPLAARRWRADQAVLDVVYDPWPTQLATAVARAGGTAISGGLMLLHQAAAQVELMTGAPAPVEAMRAALRVAAPQSGV
jgi:shikimate dehydrogenase